MRRLRVSGERGQAALEYAGILVLVAAIIGALSTFDSSGLAQNQQRVFAYIREHRGTPVGANAENAGLPAGKPISPTPVRVIHFR